jgi:hypothetical protein
MSVTMSGLVAHDLFGNSAPLEEGIGCAGQKPSGVFG